MCSLSGFAIAVGAFDVSFEIEDDDGLEAGSSYAVTMWTITTAGSSAESSPVEFETAGGADAVDVSRGCPSSEAVDLPSLLVVVGLFVCAVVTAIASKCIFPEGLPGGGGLLILVVRLLHLVLNCLSSQQIRCCLFFICRRPRASLLCFLRRGRSGGVLCFAAVATCLSWEGFLYWSATQFAYFYLRLALRQVTDVLFVFSLSGPYFVAGVIFVALPLVRTLCCFCIVAIWWRVVSVGSLVFSAIIPNALASPISHRWFSSSTRCLRLLL